MQNLKPQWLDTMALADGALSTNRRRPHGLVVDEVDLATVDSLGSIKGGLLLECVLVEELLELLVGVVYAQLPRPRSLCTAAQLTPTPPNQPPRNHRGHEGR